MRGENESVQNNLILEKLMGIMDSFKMFCVFLILVFPGDRVFFCLFVCFGGENKGNFYAQ